MLHVKVDWQWKVPNIFFLSLSFSCASQSMYSDLKAKQILETCRHHDGDPCIGSFKMWTCSRSFCMNAPHVLHYKFQFNWLQSLLPLLQLYLHADFSLGGSSNQSIPQCKIKVRPSGWPCTNSSSSAQPSSHPSPWLGTLPHLPPPPSFLSPTSGSRFGTVFQLLLSFILPLPVLRSGDRDPEYRVAEFRMLRSARCNGLPSVEGGVAKAVCARPRVSLTALAESGDETASRMLCQELMDVSWR